MIATIKTNDRFGRLTVLRRSRPNYAWCRCDCGTEKEIQIGKLTCQWTKSCGCLQKAKASKIARHKNETLRKSLIGRVFSRLTVLAIDRAVPGKYGQRYYYKVRCSCGNAKSVLGDNLVKGGTKSCGCLKHEGHPCPRRLEDGEAYLRLCYHVYAAKAKKQNLPFTLSLGEFQKLIQSNCHYCGSPPSNVARHPSRKSVYTYGGIDRKDNQEGYISTNVVPCCKQCNVAKNNHSLADFLAWAKRVVNRANY